MHGFMNKGTSLTCARMCVCVCVTVLMGHQPCGRMFACHAWGPTDLLREDEPVSNEGPRGVVSKRSDDQKQLGPVHHNGIGTAPRQGQRRQVGVGVELGELL